VSKSWGKTTRSAAAPSGLSVDISEERMDSALSPSAVSATS
jgi:hypothetical protein